jgi:hypothetical protein
MFHLKANIVIIGIVTRCASSIKTEAQIRNLCQQ